MAHARTLVILGGGYVGRQLQARHPGAVVTHRPATPRGDRELPFDLDTPATWVGLPTEGADVVWTFPARPLDAVQDFHRLKLATSRTLIVLGSTSAYQVREPGEVVTEDTPLDLSQGRVQGEEWLRAQGATVLQLAGIYGPDRRPERWLLKGLIKNGRKLVNLVHVDDIVATVEACIARPQPGKRFNVSNGLAPEWRELVARFKEHGELPKDFTLPEFEAGTDNKVVSNARLRELLPGRAFLAP